MGQGGASMFYLVAIFLLVYAVGMSIYLLVNRIRKQAGRRKGNG